MENLLFFAPFIFFPDLFLFAGCEVVLDVEGLANVFGGLALDHVRHGLARDVKQALQQNQFWIISTKPLKTGQV